MEPHGVMVPHCVMGALQGQPHDASTQHSRRKSLFDMVQVPTRHREIPVSRSSAALLYSICWNAASHGSPRKESNNDYAPVPYGRVGGSLCAGSGCSIEYWLQSQKVPLPLCRRLPCVTAIRSWVLSHAGHSGCWPGLKVAQHFSHKHP